MKTQPEKSLAEFILYNNWANQQVIAACRNLDQDQLATSLPGAYGTIRDTLEHIIRAEAFYLRLLTGTRLLPSYQWADKPDLAVISEYAVEVGQALVDAVQNVRPEDMVYEDADDGKFQYQALAIFIQIINHGIEHRTNITTILNAGGLTPPEVDGWGYLVSNPARFDYLEG